MMIRRTVAAALLAGALLVPSSEAQAQDPLRSWCYSPTMDFCFSLLSFEYEIFGQDPSITARANLEAFGSGFSRHDNSGFGVEFLMAFETTAGVENCCELNGFTRKPGEFQAVEGSTLSGTPIRDPVVDDIWSMAMFADGIEIRCGPSSSDVNPCFQPVSVPEPGTWLLMATSMLGLVIVRRRRGLLQEDT